MKHLINLKEVGVCRGGDNDPPIKLSPDLPSIPNRQPSQYEVDFRSYRHFDFVSDARDVLQKANTYSKEDFAEHVRRHAFLPFLAFELETYSWNREKRRKKVRKVRTVWYASHRDAAILQIYSQILSRKYEENKPELLEECVTAYRKLNGRVNIHFAKEAFDEIRRRERCVVCTFDLEDFFGSLDHYTLKKRWAEILGEKSLPQDHYSVYKHVTRYSYMSRGDVYKVLGHGRRKQEKKWGRICSIDKFKNQIRPNVTIIRNERPCGIIQGSPISACLSNVYMTNFDSIIAQYCKEKNAFYRRYSDDLIIICSEENEPDIKKIIFEQAEQHQLKIHPDPKKCTRVTVDAGVVLKKPIQYLGFILDGQRVLIRPGSIARYWSKMRDGVKYRKTCAKNCAKKGLPSHIYWGALLNSYARVRNGKQKNGTQKGNFVKYAHKAMLIMDERSMKLQIRKRMKRLMTLLRQRHT